MHMHKRSAISAHSLLVVSTGDIAFMVGVSHGSSGDRVQLIAGRFSLDRFDVEPQRCHSRLRLKLLATSTDCYWASKRIYF